MTNKQSQRRTLTPQSGTITDSILRLEVGDEFTTARYLDPEADKFDHNSISKYKTQLNNTVSGVAARVQKATGRRYQTESAVFNTTRNRIYVAVIVNRLD